MAVMDHKHNQGGHCVWCHGSWPCPTGRIRRELAEYIRNLPIGDTGDSVYDCGREAGRDSAADSIDYEN